MKRQCRDSLERLWIKRSRLVSKELGFTTKGEWTRRIKLLNGLRFGLGFPGGKDPELWYSSLGFPGLKSGSFAAWLETCRPAVERISPPGVSPDLLFLFGSDENDWKSVKSVTPLLVQDKTEAGSDRLNWSRIGSMLCHGNAPELERRDNTVRAEGQVVWEENHKLAWFAVY